MNADLGYDYEQLLYVPLKGADKDNLVLITEKLRQYPEVEAAELTYSIPLEKTSGNNIMLPDNPSKYLMGVCDQYEATEGFFDMMGFRLIEGKAPSKPKDVAVSRSFVDEMNLYAEWSDGAVGKDILISEHSDDDDDVYTICGVFEDYIIGSMMGRDRRASIRFCWNTDWNYGTEDWSRAMNKPVVKVREVNPSTIEKVKSVVEECLPERNNIEVTPYTELFKKEYAELLQMRRTFTIGALFALAIALIGLIGFVRDESNRRSKEVAIRISLSSMYFIIGAVVVLLIVTVVVVLSSNRVARMNPVKSLKNN